MNRDIQQHPEFSRAQNLIEEAAMQMEMEGGDVHSFASCLLTQAAAFYKLVHGTTGPDGLPVALAKLATAEAQRAAQDHEAQGQRAN